MVEAGSQSKERGGEDREEGGGDRPLIDVKLVFEMEEETRRRTSEAARGGEGEMRGHEKVRDVGGVDFSGDSSVVAGRARVLENSATIRSDPDETEDCSVESRGGGAKVVDCQVGLGELGDRCQMKGRVRGVANSDDGLRV